MSLENISCQKSFGGWHKRYRHRSASLNCDMVFAVYLPPQAEQGEKLPVLYWLSGLTCTDENFMQKAGAHRLAAELGLIIVASHGRWLWSGCYRCWWLRGRRGGGLLGRWRVGLPGVRHRANFTSRPGFFERPAEFGRGGGIGLAFD